MSDLNQAAPTEREVFLTGIGGQGVQLAGKILALAATAEGRNVMSLGTYGGTMRGGNTDATIVVAEGRVVSPPVVSRGWSAIVVHPRYWPPLLAKLRPNGVVVFDTDLASAGLETGDARVFGVAASKLAQEAGASRAGALVLLGAYSAITGLVGRAALEHAIAEALPPYRHQHLEANVAAIGAGFDAVEALSAPAWVA